MARASSVSTKSSIVKLDSPLRFAKGVGDALAALFAKKDLFTFRDALHFLPRIYEDRRTLKSIERLVPGEKATVVGRIVRAHPVFYSKSRRRAFEVWLEHDSSKRTLQLTWFQMPYGRDKWKEGFYVVARGEVKLFRGNLTMAHPDIELLGKTYDESQVTRSIVPIYSETSGLYQKTIRKIIQSLLNLHGHEIEERLPESLRQTYHFPSKREALVALHRPPVDADFEKLNAQETLWHQRLIFEEFFELALGLEVKRKCFCDEATTAFEKPKSYWESFGKHLGFRFTGAQRRVLQDIVDDMTSTKRMHRLVQGDVGCGKTAVAAAAALVALESGAQVALMAPTEVLVDQHRHNFEQWFKDLPIQLVRLTGSQTAKEKRDILNRLKSEKSLMVFGTQALFEPSVDFQNLGLVIVDEQHRFGVRQRAALLGKGPKPHLLVMTATPIPRTLALTLYGDLDLSVIDEMPPGRKAIQTKVFTDRQRERLDAQVKAELEAGHQAYWIFPLIEESEVLKLKSIQSTLDSLRASYAGYTVEALHGRLSATEKARILADFKEGKISILVSTTVVEVGVDNPKASVMVIENAERFGLSQLHQLRGRVGRGARESYCFLVAAHLATPEIRQRLQIMEETNDGFKIAQVDLEMRGSGEFLGTRQSGLPQFQVARLPRDLSWLYKARQEVKQLLEQDPTLDIAEGLKSEIEARWARVDLN